MHRLFFIILSLFLLCLETTTTANQLATVGGGAGHGVIKKCSIKERISLLDFKACLQGPLGVMNKCSDKERLSLFHFRALLQDPQGCLSTWTAEEDDCCRWSGVTCNKPTGRVTELDISYCDLVGEISPSLLNLTNLYHFDLSGNSFHGTIPKFIGSMTQLEYLSLSDNSFHGTIPPELGNLTNLQDLWLSYVGRCRVENLEWLSHLSVLEGLGMSGTSLAKQNHWVDIILSLPKLWWLNLEGCELSQVMYPFSSSFLNSSSSSIQYLYLRNNSLTLSMYPWLFPLTSNRLYTLDLSSNMLDRIPTYLADLCSLEILYFFDNSAVVKFPYFLNNLSGCTSLSLRRLYASGSQLTGPLPDEILKFTSLTYLDLSDNHLNGTITDKLWELPNLEFLDISSNYLKGAISKNIGKSNRFDRLIANVHSTVALLNLSRNKLSGGISFLCQFVSGFLVILDLSHNSLSGQLPDCLWHFKELKVFNLEHNNLSGRLPASVGSLIKLEALDLYKNSFSGDFPLSLRNCTSLKLLNFGANNFSGNLPVWIGENLSGLYVLTLRSNHFFGTIPLQLCELASLQILDLSVNHFHGTIPSCLSNLTFMAQQGFSQVHNVYNDYSKTTYSYNVDHVMIQWQGTEREFIRTNLVLLRSIDLSSNNFTGKIPNEIINLTELIALNLSKNALHGEIPWEISWMQKLLTLDLSRNNFSGQIPSSMSQMHALNYLDVSDNSLLGRIPSSTQLQSFDSSRYSGNVGLCGPPLSKGCPGDEESQVPSVVGKSECDEEGDDEVEIWLYIGVGSGFPIGFWIACGALLLNRRGRNAFFHFYDNFKDWVYVKVAVKR